MSEGISVLSAAVAVPRVSARQWQATGAFARWLIASRAAVLVMTFSSAAVGGALALLSGRFDPLAWCLCVAGLVLAHAANNQLNDLTDSVRGIDRGNYFRNQYGTHVVEAGLLTPHQLFALFTLTGAVALAIGIYLCLRVGSAVMWPLAAGAFLCLAYTYPLKQWGLGELAVLIVWGPLMTGATFLVATGQWSVAAAAVGTLYALGPTMVIFGKHIDKLDFDLAKRMRTLPVRLGERAARHCVTAMMVAQWASLLTLVFVRILPWQVLLAAGALPDAWRLLHAYRRHRPPAAPTGYPAQVWPLWFASFAFAYTRAFGLLFLVGLLLAWLMQ